MSVVAIIEASLAGRSLPRSVLLPLGDGTVLDQAVARARAVARSVAVCTTSGSADDAVAIHCAERGIPCVRGPEVDWFRTVRRALDSRRLADSQWFFHVPATSPLFSLRLARALLQRGDALEAEGRRVHLVTADESQMVAGGSVRLVRRSSFEAIDQTSLSPADKHAIALPLLRAPFQCAVVEAPAALRHPSLRLTLETPADYAVLSALFGLHERPTAEAVIPTLLGNPDLAGLNNGASSSRRPRL